MPRLWSALLREFASFAEREHAPFRPSAADGAVVALLG